MKTHIDGTLPQNNEIFVFGSNLAGRHGAGAALAAAQKFGAKYGVGIGMTGNSYAIPTKDEFIISLDLETIKFHISEFNSFVECNPDKEFFLTRVGCQLAGFKDEVIAPLFKKFDNVNYPEQWVNLVS